MTKNISGGTSYLNALAPEVHGHIPTFGA